MSNKAFIPGSYDPITIGHKDIILRASKEYDQVVVGVGINPDKDYLFTLEERVNLAKKSLQDIDNCLVIGFEGLTVDEASKHECEVIIKGVRNEIDVRYELAQACYNKKLNPNIKTRLLKSNPKYSNISSTLVREKAKNHEDISTLVDNNIIDDIKKKVK